MPASAFEVERIRLEAARSLPANCFDDFLRLSKKLMHGPTFQWLLVDAPYELLRIQVMAALERVLHAAGLQVDRLPLGGRRIPDVATLEERLRKSARAAAVVQVIVQRGWFDAARWDAFNVLRERIAAGARARLVFWLDAEAIALASCGAPDLWAWRSGVYAFVPVGSSPGATSMVSASAFNLTLQPDGFDGRSMIARHRRIAEIRAWIESHPDAPVDLLVAPFYELGRLLYDVGDYNDALTHYRQQELPLHQARGDQRSVAVTQGKIADIMMARGQLDEALRIRIEEELPVYELLGDVRSKAATQSRIAAILTARGELDEALRILTDAVLVAFERLGDERERAVTQGRIVEILMLRGQLDAAVRILRQEVLPAFERLGDVREKAVTQGRIAGVLRARGQLDEALRIHREEALPVFERLGDVRSKAVTQGRIADILIARGQPNEALRILRDDVLPVFERLGVYQGKAVTKARIADALIARGQPNEALRILREEVLPVFERLGDQRWRALTRCKIGLLLLDGDSAKAAEAKQLLDAAYADLSRMGLLEAEQLAEEMRKRGLTPPAG